MSYSLNNARTFADLKPLKEKKIKMIHNSLTRLQLFHSFNNIVIEILQFENTAPSVNNLRTINACSSINTQKSNLLNPPEVCIMGFCIFQRKKKIP